MWRIAVLACALICHACIRDELTQCGDQLCPASSLCTTGGCATHDEVDACIGSVEAAPCMLDGMDGFCLGGACRLTRCGDNRTDPSEACDDGNQLYADGCAGDCRSTEVCGNSVIDPIVGEECDSGVVGLARDGCTSTCTLEVEVWRELKVGPPSTRFGAALATAPSGMLLFGGLPQITAGNDTYGFDGSRWMLREVTVSPRQRGRAGLAYDSARRRVVLFGGNDGTTYLNDTWEYDGVTWTQRMPAMAPAARNGLGMVFDSDRNRIVLFGGMDASGYFGDTWEWDGTTWTQVATTGPAPRGTLSLAYDPSAHRTVLFGGATTGSTTLNDTWTWDGSTWTQLSSPNPPAPRSGAPMAFDPISRKVILFGGFVNFQDTWAWDGAAWTQLAPSYNPPPRAFASMALDSVTNSLILFGGRVNLGSQGSNDTYRWDGSSWYMWTGNTDPTAGNSAYDPQRGLLLTYDPYGGGGPGLLGWDGLAWSKVGGADAGVRSQFVLAFDRARQTVVMFSGNLLNGLNDDTWEWNGTWTKRTPATVPPARIASMMVYDEARHVSVLFGGLNAGTRLGDTWTWDGNDWTQHTTSPAPSAREQSVMAYDAARQRVVLFGGLSVDGIVGDTWLWDGSTWTEVTGLATSPRPRGAAVMAYDPRTQRVILTGGGLPDTWSWNGASWTQELPVVDPVPVSFRGLGPDRKGTLIAYGGGTWRFAWESTGHPAERCLEAVDSDHDALIGCDDPDCWTRCAPTCPPATSCDPAQPHCGDGSCSAVEDYLLCPSDCTVP